MPGYTTVKIAEGFYSIEMGFVRGFLIEGEKEALLIDTGVGNGDLRKFVEELTKLPVTVLFTHADGDHVGAAAQFDRRLMHPSEFDYYKSKKGDALSMEPVWEGSILDLGSYRFEVILLPGHTPGSIALLEKDKRFLIGGDSIQTGSIFMFGSGRNPRAFHASMKRLQGRLSEFDTVYSSHGPLSIAPDTVNRLYEASGKLLEGKLTGTPEPRFDGKVKNYESDGVAFFAD